MTRWGWPKIATSHISATHPIAPGSHVLPSRLKNPILLGFFLVAFWLGEFRDHIFKYFSTTTRARNLLLCVCVHMCLYIKAELLTITWLQQRWGFKKKHQRSWDWRRHCKHWQYWRVPCSSTPKECSTAVKKWLDLLTIHFQRVYTLDFIQDVEFS